MDYEAKIKEKAKESAKQTTENYLRNSSLSIGDKQYNSIQNVMEDMDCLEKLNDNNKLQEYYNKVFRVRNSFTSEDVVQIVNETLQNVSETIINSLFSDDSTGLNSIQDTLNGTKKKIDDKINITEQIKDIIVFLQLNIGGKVQEKDMNITGGNNIKPIPTSDDTSKTSEPPKQESKLSPTLQKIVSQVKPNLLKITKDNIEIGRDIDGYVSYVAKFKANLSYEDLSNLLKKSKQDIQNEYDISKFSYSCRYEYNEADNTAMNKKYDYPVAGGYYDLTLTYSEDGIIEDEVAVLEITDEVIWNKEFQQKMVKLNEEIGVQKLD